MTMHRAVSPTEPTPRSLSALSAYHTGLIAPMKIRTEAPGNLRLYSGSPTRSEKEQVSISSFYYKERKSRRWKSKREGSDSGNRPIKAAGKVIIQDVSCLLPVHKSLGELYILAAWKPKPHFPGDSSGQPGPSDEGCSPKSTCSSASSSSCAICSWLTCRCAPAARPDGPDGYHRGRCGCGLCSGTHPGSRHHWGLQRRWQC